MISIIITSYNEGDWVLRTVESVRQNTSDCEIIIVDDASTDGSCDNAGADLVVKHAERIGIAQSRIDGVAAARGDVYAFLDAHQLLSEGCLNQCADRAREYQAIVCPCTRGPVDREWRQPGQYWTGHGSMMSQQDNGLFVGRWRNYQPKDRLSRCSMMVVPGYCIPKAVYPVVRWIDGLLQWGGSEPCVCVKAFFADVDILHCCGPIARHLFRGKTEDGKIDRAFSAPFSITWRNHALTCRVCFDDKTWRDYWIPHVFAKWNKGGDWSEFDRTEILKQREEFQQWKRRPDEEFWIGLMDAKPFPSYAG